MGRLINIMLMNVVASGGLYFGFAGIEKHILPQLFSFFPAGSWSAPASWGTWTPSVLIPFAVTAYSLNPKMAIAGLVGIVGMWGGFMVTDFQQPPFIDILRQFINI